MRNLLEDLKFYVAKSPIGYIQLSCFPVINITVVVLANVIMLI